MGEGGWDEGGGSSLELCTVCPSWELIWIGDSQYCAPLRRWKIKSPAHSATAQESGINRVTHSWVKKSGEKIDYTFMGTGLFNLLFSQWNPASQGLYLRVRETEGGTRKKKILASKTIMGSPMRLSLLWVFFTAPKTRANNRGSKLTFASFLHINSRLILLHMWFLTVRNNALLLEFAEGPTAHRKPLRMFQQPLNSDSPFPRGQLLRWERRTHIFVFLSTLTSALMALGILQTKLIYLKIKGWHLCCGFCRHSSLMWQWRPDRSSGEHGCGQACLCLASSRVVSIVYS